MKIVNGNQLHLEDDKAVYVHVGRRVIYIDNSTGEMIVDMWEYDDDEHELNLILTRTSPEAEQGKVLIEAMSQFLKIIDHALKVEETV